MHVMINPYILALLGTVQTGFVVATNRGFIHAPLPISISATSSSSTASLLAPKVDIFERHDAANSGYVDLPSSIISALASTITPISALGAIFQGPKVDIFKREPSTTLGSPPRVHIPKVNIFKLQEATASSLAQPSSITSSLSSTITPMIKTPKVEIFRRELKPGTNVAPFEGEIDPEIKTCGYANGNTSDPRTAGPGYDCRVDIESGLWGFCPTALAAVSDCNLAGFCQDSAACSIGCGLESRTNVASVTCPIQNFCSTAILTTGSQSYSYIACGEHATTDHLIAAFTVTAVSSEPSTSDGTFAATSSSQSPVSSTAGSSGTISSSTTTSAPSTEPTKSHHTGPIIGAVFGSIGLLAFAVLGFIWVWKRTRQTTHTFSEI